MVQQYTYKHWPQGHIIVGVLRVDRLGGIPESSSSPEPGDMDRYGAHLPDAVESAAVVLHVTVKVSTVKVSAAAHMG